MHADRSAQTNDVPTGEYEIVRPEDLPIQHALEEWLQERAEVRRSREMVAA